MAAPSPPAAPLCAVCLGDVASSLLSTLLECAHAFCEPCIAAWAARGKRACPLCRAPFTGWRHAFEDGDATHFRTHTLPDATALHRTAEALRAAAAADEAEARQVRAWVSAASRLALQDANIMSADAFPLSAGRTGRRLRRGARGSTRRAPRSRRRSTVSPPQHGLATSSGCVGRSRRARTPGAQRLPPPRPPTPPRRRSPSARRCTPPGVGASRLRRGVARSPREAARVQSCATGWRESCARCCAPMTWRCWCTSRCRCTRTSRTRSVSPACSSNTSASLHLACA